VRERLAGVAADEAGPTSNQDIHAPRSSSR
jgi:hypothetical protein